MRSTAIRRILSRYKQLGGWHVVREYARMGILREIIKVVIVGLAKKKQPKLIYSEILDFVRPQLAEMYRSEIPLVVEKYKGLVTPASMPDVIWFCWLQGIECAPEIVKKCYRNLLKYLPEKEVIIVDEHNINQYVCLPEIIVERWREHKIPAALYSDIIRLELLIKYGGTWVDSTVLCTGANIPKEYINSKLFFFQYKRQENSGFRGISNWFITAHPGHPMLMMLRDLLIRYWEKYDCVLNFFIFHLFFSLLVDYDSSLIEDMPYGYSPNCLFLEHHLAEKYDSKNWNSLTSRVCFHKLTYRLDKNITNKCGNYYDMIISDRIC